jgi:hypothetical protein
VAADEEHGRTEMPITTSKPVLGKSAFSEAISQSVSTGE